MDRIYRLNLINSCTGYKSANLIGTVSTENIHNVASPCLANSLSTKILPLCSSVMNFFLDAISNWTWGGIVKKDPAEAPLSTATTANPFLTLALILLYEINNDPSILDWKVEDFFKRSLSSFSVSFKGNGENGIN